MGAVEILEVINSTLPKTAAVYSSGEFDRRTENTQGLVIYGCGGLGRRVLKGAKQIIARDRPVLAICIYQKPMDLWQIPLKINDLAEGYQFFLRPHGDEIWELVCYAVPVERAVICKMFFTRQSIPI